jgi:hypothetical protein
VVGGKKGARQKSLFTFCYLRLVVGGKKKVGSKLPPTFLLFLTTNVSLKRPIHAKTRHDRELIDAFVGDAVEIEYVAAVISVGYAECKFELVGR